MANFMVSLLDIISIKFVSFCHLIHLLFLFPDLSKGLFIVKDTFLELRLFLLTALFEGFKLLSDIDKGSLQFFDLSLLV